MPFLPFKRNCKLQTRLQNQSRDILGFAVFHEKPDAKGLWCVVCNFVKIIDGSFLQEVQL